MKLLTRTLLIIITILGLATFVLPTSKAAAQATCGPNSEPLMSDSNEDSPTCCPKGSQTDPETAAHDCFYAKYINPTVKVLSAVAGVAVIIGIAIGGLQYSSSGGDPQKSAAGKGKIIKAIYGLFAFLFLFGVLQFFSPGGLGSNPAPDTSRGGTLANQCSKPFLGLKPWFIYLPDSAFSQVDGKQTCNVENFSFFGSKGDGQGSQALNVSLAIVDDLIRIAGLIAVAFVIVGGAKYVTSQGSPENTKQAKDSIINALVGLVVVIVAAAVVSFIGNRLT